MKIVKEVMGAIEAIDRKEDIDCAGDILSGSLMALFMRRYKLTSFVIQQPGYEVHVEVKKKDLN
ncbi:hypothetical protein ETB87_10360 [Salmonella enterica subsp. enterica serovar Cerro]|uniref:Uncharacterized protein n=1 Tax=Salmonella virus VSiP TaxID=2301721 RepID=A0A385EGY8_9CAUD|nr:hypothetical protein PF627_gp43 [Salmonella virus VSiP]EBH9641871.1 hypothetical protein [Salmonella enterica subsp. enterica serovar Cerro]QFR58954.1 hypothetical protein vsia_42 [Salmonella virus VSiA]AXQ70228.1 hypothetical protein vsip_43 [Salmonella virus VSiP]EEJ0683693.1 hypothetical protein [Salmonella enterica subsp. enterica serovar Cerro]EKB6958509.1 hypothetical protein [Salmonella enterica subsp. enterica serovar Cerro]